MDPPPPSTESLNSDSNPPPNSVPKLKLMCSFGGHIVPRPHDKSLCYVGGDTRIVVIDRTRLSAHDLINRVSRIVSGGDGGGGFVLKYQLPSEDLDSLISVTTDEDLENMVEEYDRLSGESKRVSRIRLFLFPVKQEVNLGVFEGSIRSEDWFLSALNGRSSVGGLSGSNSVNSLLGLNEEGGGKGGIGGLGGISGKNVDVHSVVESLDRNSSFGSDVHFSGLGGNLAPVGIKEENVGGDGKVVDGVFEGSDVGKVVVAANLSLEKVVGDNVGKGLSDDEKSEHGETGYRRQLQQQQQAQLMASQLNQRSGGGGRDLASPDSVSSDSSLTNPLSRQRPMMYQDPNVQYAPVQSRVTANPVEQKITDPRIQIQQQYQDSGYLLPPQYDPQHHPQFQQPQFIRAGSQYVQHIPVGAVPMPSYYPIYSSQQPQHSHHPALEQQYPVYYVPARQTQAYSMPVQHADYSEAAGAAPSNRPQVISSAAMAPPSSGQYSMASGAATAPKSEVPASMYRTANTAAPSVVQVPSGQPRPQYVGFSQIHHPQPSNPSPATATAYAYEFADPTQAHVYYAQPLAPQMAPQYQTMTSPAPQMAAQYQTMTSAAPESTAQLPTDSIKQQVRTSQPSQMDSNTSEYFVSHGSLSSLYYQGKEDGNMIDLGLSLKTLQPQAYHPSGHGDYGELIDWQQLHPQLRTSNYEFSRNVTYDSAEDTDGGQSKSECAYVKTNMDGVVVGRKVCLFDHSDYSSLAMQLEDMFGKQSVSGLHLFHAASEYCLFYKDRDDQWRNVGDVPWRKFIERVKRLRIVHKNEVGMSSSASFS